MWSIYGGEEMIKEYFVNYFAKIKVLKKFVKPWRYSHAQGAQRWVKKVIPKIK